MLVQEKTQQPTTLYSHHRALILFYLFAHDQNQAEAEAEDDDDDEDVLLVSDWDENVEGVDVLDECDVADGSRRTDHNHDHQISANREQTGRGRHTVEAQPRKDPGGSIETEDEEDVLLVGDYDPDTEEEAGLVEILSPVTSPRRATGSPEVRQTFSHGTCNCTVWS